LAPLTVLVLAYFEPANIVFAAACLHVALADGFAAIVGVRFGKANTYKILSNSKSIAGTATFFVMSVLIMMGVMIFGGVDISISLAALLLVSASTTLVENLAFSSIDNTLIILTVVGLFKVLNIA
jgi:dolichol kinase